jgi:hypothetical protein
MLATVALRAERLQVLGIVRSAVAAVYDDWTDADGHPHPSTCDD